MALRIVGLVLSLHVILGTCICGEEYFLAQGFENWNGVKTFFHAKSEEDLNTLKFHRSPKISLYANWLLTVADGRRDAKTLVLSQHEFFGFTSAKFGFSIPQWWKDRSVYFASLRACSEPIGEFLPDWSKDFSTTNEVLHSNDIQTLELETSSLEVQFRDGSKLEVVQKNRNWDFEDSFRPESVECFAIASVGDRIFFAASGKRGNEFSIYSVDKNCNKLWSATVARTRQQMMIVGGDWDGVIEIKVGQDCIGVFTADLDLASLDVFDLETGAVQTRFTTLFEKW